MNSLQRKIIEERLNFEINDNTFENFIKYSKLFLEYNSHTNLMSKNDEKVLFEKHIFDSLSLNLFFQNYNVSNMLDIGTGGGFPSLPVALAFPTIEVVAIDSIQKKMNFIESVKKELDLKNIKTICTRAENFDAKMLNSFDMVTCRAVSALKNLFDYTIPYIKKDGYFVAFKSKIYEQELEDAKNIIKKSKVKLIDVIDYALPLTENFERKLLIFQKL